MFPHLNFLQRELLNASARDDASRASPSLARCMSVDPRTAITPEPRSPVCFPMVYSIVIERTYRFPYLRKLTSGSIQHCIAKWRLGFALRKTKKADVAEHPKVSHHVGLLANEPPGAAELLSI
jgi:hypothetical protein